MRPNTWIVLRIAAITILTLLLYIVLAALVHVGFTWLPWLTLVVSFAGMGWLAHTSESRQLVEDFERALADSGLSLKEAAYWMQISEPQLSRQRAGLEMLSASRIASLPAAFQVAFAKRRLARFGGYTVMESGVVADLVAAVRALTERREQRA
jgi:hypothetical protein